MVMTLMTLGTALLLSVAPVWATPFLLVLGLLPRAQALGPVGILAGVLAVLAARAAGEVAAFLARVAWMVAMVLRK